MTLLNDLRNQDLSTGDITHSSGYASAASGDSIGSSADGVSMEQRRQLMHSRTTIGSYTQSHLGRRYGAIRPRTADGTKGRAYDESAGVFIDKVGYSNRERTGVKVKERNRNQVQIDKSSASIERRTHFIEPPARNYNPFG